MVGEHQHQFVGPNSPWRQRARKLFLAEAEASMIVLVVCKHSSVKANQAEWVASYGRELVHPIQLATALGEAGR
jgi:hypothetical protein